MIDVVAGVLVERGRILLTQRRPEKDFPFAWECPGGKVEEGESHADALRRELLEELRIQVNAVGSRPIFAREFRNEVRREDRRHIKLHFYRVLTSGTPAVTEDVLGLGWFTAGELGGLVLAPGNVAAREELPRDILGSASI